jgi:hypothetical protein
MVTFVPYPYAKAMDTIDVENVDQTIKDEDGREVCIESAPSTVPSIAHVDSVEDVAGINGTIAELSIMFIEVTVQIRTGLEESHESR